MCKKRRADRFLDLLRCLLLLAPILQIVITHPEREHGTAFQFDFHFEGGIRVISNKELHARLPSSVEDFFRGFNISTLVSMVHRLRTPSSLRTSVSSTTSTTSTTSTFTFFFTLILEHSKWLHLSASLHFYCTLLPPFGVACR